VRYADDFIITCRNRDKLEGDILDRVTTFLAERGMTLSEKKTKIVDLKQEGFKFLG
jgi:RNA-directed DNA polymerase